MNTIKTIKLLLLASVSVGGMFGYKDGDVCLICAQACLRGHKALLGES